MRPKVVRDDCHTWIKWDTMKATELKYLSLHYTRKFLMGETLCNTFKLRDIKLRDYYFC